MNLLTKSYAILSAFTSARSKEDNLIQHKLTLESLRADYYIVNEVEGLTKEWGNEKSLIVHGIPREEAKRMASALNQEAFIYFFPTGLWELIYTQDESKNEYFNSMYLRGWDETVCFDLADNWTRLDNGLAFTLR